MVIAEACEVPPREEVQVIQQALPVAGIEPLAKILPDDAALIEAHVHQRHHIQHDIGHEVGGVVVFDDAHHRRVTGQVVPEEILRLGGLHQVHVVVEVEEVLRQIRDAVHIQLDGMGAEGGQILLRDEVPVVDDMQLGMVRLQPCRQVSVGQQVYLSHPRGVLLDAPEPIAEQPPLPVAGGVIVGAFRGPVFGVIRLPDRVRPVHPWDHDVNGMRAHWSCAPSFFCSSAAQSRQKPTE